MNKPEAPIAAHWEPTRLLDAVHANRAFKKNPRMIARAKDMHYYTPEAGPSSTARRAVVLQRRP
jgi:hypothetical protein